MKLRENCDRAIAEAIKNGTLKIANPRARGNGYRLGVISDEFGVIEFTDTLADATRRVEEVTQLEGL